MVLLHVLKLSEPCVAANFSLPGSRVTCLNFSQDNWICNGIVDTSMWKGTYKMSLPAPLRAQSSEWSCAPY